MKAPPTRSPPTKLGSQLPFEDDATSTRRKLFVAGIPRGGTRGGDKVNDLRARLKAWFEVEHHLQIVDVEGLDADRGYCFVTMASEEDANRALTLDPPKDTNTGPARIFKEIRRATVPVPRASEKCRPLSAEEVNAWRQSVDITGGKNVYRFIFILRAFFSLFVLLGFRPWKHEIGSRITPAPVMFWGGTHHVLGHGFSSFLFFIPPLNLPSMPTRASWSREEGGRCHDLFIGLPGFSISSLS
uniref:RRM domain-containing protein n=1 Tax=Octactis speculum TaxID=3111310 RepID=A0A7S2CIR5_9STRA